VRTPAGNVPPASEIQHAKTPLNRTPSPRQANETQLISSFWEIYSASASRYPGPTEPVWLYRSISSATAATAPTLLNQALLSLAYIRLGRLNDDQALVIKGQQIYGQSLHLMQRALHDPILAHNDDTLVAARCMVLYESFESTSGDMAAWQNHILGIARIIHLRGVHRHCDPVSRSVLESMRYNVMIVSLMRSTASFLSEPEWLTVPWAGVSKGLDQRLFDYGFTLANMMQKSEATSMSLSSQQHQQHHAASTQKDVLDILEQTLACYIGLEGLLTELLSKRTTASHDVNSTPLQNHHHLPWDIQLDYDKHAETGPDAISFAILLALDLSFSVFATALVKQHCSHHDHNHNDDQTPASHHSRRVDLFAQLARYIAPARRLRLAQQLLRHLHLCCSVRAEHLRPRIIYPLNVLRWEMRHRPAEEAQVRALFELVASRDQFRIARGVRDAGKAVLPGIVLEAER
jgi:hypothetical protein